jgi:hypothetical protein
MVSTNDGDHAHTRVAVARHTVATNAGDARAGAGDASVAPSARTGCAGFDRYAAYEPPYAPAADQAMTRSAAGAERPWAL